MEIWLKKTRKNRKKIEEISPLTHPCTQLHECVNKLTFPSFLFGSWNLFQNHPKSMSKPQLSCAQKRNES